MSDIATMDFHIVIKAPPPVMSPIDGTFTEDVPVVISCPLLSECKIFYSLDGSVPTEASLLYTSAFNNSTTNTVMKSISVVPGKSPSDVVSSTPIVIEPFAPKFIAAGQMASPVVSKGGVEEEEFEGSATIYLRCRTPGAHVHYSMTNQDPTASSPVYVPGTPIVLSKAGATTIKAFAMKIGMTPSPLVSSDIFEILSRVSEPDIELTGGGPYSESVLVTLKEFTSSSDIYFTLDSSEPTKLSTLYTEPFSLRTIGRNTVKAIGTKGGLADSKPTSATFLVLEKVKIPVFDPAFGTFTDSITVHLSCATTGAQIRYTTNGDTPSAGSAEYINGTTLGLRGGEEATYQIKAIGMNAPAMGNSDVSISEDLVVQPQVIPPTISPTIVGPFENKVVVTITTDTPASIRYTTDGSEPFVNSALYDSKEPPILFKTNSTLKAIAIAPHMAASVISESVAYEIEVVDPTFQPDGGEFVDSAQVTIVCSKPGAFLHYTLDSSDPTSASPMYKSPLALGQTGLVIKAIAIHPDLLESEVTESVPFVIKAFPPIISPHTGIFVGQVLIHVTSETQGAQVHCSLDGTTPGVDSPICGSPLTVVSTGVVIKAVTFKEGLALSDVATSELIIIKAVAPKITPDRGSFTNEVLVVMSCEEPGCKMHYVQDAHSTPTTTSPMYTEAIKVTKVDTVIRAIAVADGKHTSDIVSTSRFEILADAAIFAANGTRWDKGVNDDEVMDFVEDVTIMLETSTPDAVIVYTTDGELITCT